MLNFRTEKFYGPLALLLQLIEKEEMDITEISLAKIADQYVDYIKNSEKISAETIADFLVIAAKLLFIKSKALLPYLYPDEEEEIEELTEQLRMYKEFLEATRKIENILKKKKFMFAREFNRKAILASSKFFSPPKKIRKEEIMEIFVDLLSKIKPIEEELEKKELEHKVNIEDKILAIKNMVFNKIKLSFNKILKNSKSRTEIIVSFLAMLELMKRREINVNQEGLFKEIKISKT